MESAPGCFNVERFENKGIATGIMGTHGDGAVGRHDHEGTRLNTLRIESVSIHKILHKERQLMDRPSGCEHVLFDAPPQGKDIAKAAPVPARMTVRGFEVLPEDLTPGGAPVNHDMAKVAEELAVELLIRDDGIEVPVDGECERIVVALRVANEDCIPG